MNVNLELELADAELLHEMLGNWNGWADQERKSQIRAYVALRIAEAKGQGAFPL